MDATVEEFSPEFIQIASGLLGAEGPVFDKTGHFYMVAPEVEDQGKPAGEILKIDLVSKEVTILAKPKAGTFGGIPAGCQCDQDGNLWVADMRLGLLRVTPEGKYKQVTRRDFTFQTIQGCNDCVFDYNGNLWITAPAGKIAPDPYQRSMQEPFGVLYCYLPQDEVLFKVDSKFKFCNGIAVQHTDDGSPKRLIVAETGTKTLWGYDIVEPGKVENKKVWGKVPGEHEGGPDGMDFDCAGNLLVANWGSSYIEVYGPDGGQPLCRIKCPFSNVSNLHFKPNAKEVYVTEHTNNALWKFDWKHEGKPQYCDLMVF